MSAFSVAPRCSRRRESSRHVSAVTDSGCDIGRRGAEQPDGKGPRKRRGRSTSSFGRRSSCAEALASDAADARAPTTTTNGTGRISTDRDRSGSMDSLWQQDSKARAATRRARPPPTLLNVVTGLRSARRSHLQLDNRPLHDSTYERFSRFAGTTNIHGFLPLARLREMGW